MMKILIIPIHAQEVIQMIVPVIAIMICMFATTAEIGDVPMQLSLCYE